MRESRRIVPGGRLNTYQRELRLKTMAAIEECDRRLLALEQATRATARLLPSPLANSTLADLGVLASDWEESKALFHEYDELWRRWEG